MKIISWNCQGGFRNKVDVIISLQPDILVVQECEHIDKIVFDSTQSPTDILWLGDNKNKGLGVFSFNGYELNLLEQYNSDIKIIAPISVTGGQLDYTLFAVWANNPDEPKEQYIEQAWKAIYHYDQLLENGQIIMTGDFNSNKIWDKPNKVGNHSQVVARLEEKKIYSLYHHHSTEEHGKESLPTFFLQRKIEKPYHIDYFFVSNDLFDKVDSFEIGSYDKWIAYSDHVPIIVNFKE